MRHHILIVCTDSRIEPAAPDRRPRRCAPAGRLETAIKVVRVLIPAVLPATLPITAWPPRLADRLDRLREAAERGRRRRCAPPCRVEIVPCRSVSALLDAVWPVDALVLVGSAGWGVRRAARGVAPERGDRPGQARGPPPAGDPVIASPRRCRSRRVAADASMTATEGVLSRSGARGRARADVRPTARRRPRRASRWAPIALSLGALGVVYGDIGTSPLYTVQLIFSGDHPMGPSPLRVYGALSLIVWALLRGRHAEVRAPDPARRQPRRGRHHGAGGADRAR